MVIWLQYIAKCKQVFLCVQICWSKIRFIHKNNHSYFKIIRNYIFKSPLSSIIAYEENLDFRIVVSEVTICKSRTMKDNIVKS